jgi:hypothetical protein
MFPIDEASARSSLQNVKVLGVKRRLKLAAG